MIRVLVIGVGRWGEQHLRVLGDLGVERWICDVSPDRRERAVSLGIAPSRTVADYRAVLDAVDAVDIVTPATNHLEIATACLQAGRPCLVEKPLTLTVAEARRLEQRVRDTGGRLQVGHTFRFHPVTEALRGALVAGRIGAVRYATGRFAGFKRPRTDVGVTQTDAIHYFDLFAFLLGAEATAVTALQRDFLGRGIDDMAVVLVEYGGVPVMVEVGYFTPGTHRDCVIVGEEGSLVADFGRSTVVVHATGHRPEGLEWATVDYGAQELKVARDEPLRLELERFIDAVTLGEATAVDVADGRRALEVVEAATRSSHLGRRVSIQEIRGGSATGCSAPEAAPGAALDGGPSRR